MKKYVSVLLILTLLLTVIPTTTAQAAVTLSDTKIELSEGDTLTLKLNGTEKTVIWNTTNRSVAMVTSEGVVTAAHVGKAKITAKVGKKKYVCKVTVVKNIKTIKPIDAWRFVNDDMLGYGFYVLQNYINNGKSSYGEDFDTTLKNLDSNMIKLSQYNDSINAFDGEEYNDLKAAWSNLFNEVTAIYKSITENPPQINNRNYKLDLTNAGRYLDAFLDECKYFE